MKNGQILNIKVNKSNLEFDIRVNIPASSMTSEAIIDLIANKENLINGNVVECSGGIVNLETTVSIDDKNNLKFEKTSHKLGWV